MRLSATHANCSDRLTPLGIAATAALPRHSNVAGCTSASRHLESRRLRLSIAVKARARVSRLTPLGIAATAAVHDSHAPRGNAPPHATWNRGDCGRCWHTIRPCAIRPASRHLESRRLRLSKRDAEDECHSAASRHLESRRLRRRWKRALGRCNEPPHATWNRGDCGPMIRLEALPSIIRLTPLGIAATAARLARIHVWTLDSASRHLESRRLRQCQSRSPPHLGESASRHLESRRLRQE